MRSKGFPAVILCALAFSAVPSECCLAQTARLPSQTISVQVRPRSCHPRHSQSLQNVRGRSYAGSARGEGHGRSHPFFAA